MNTPKSIERQSQFQDVASDNSRQWERDLTPGETEWYKTWIAIIRVQRKRVSRTLDRMSGRKEMNKFWSDQL